MFTCSSLKSSQMVFLHNLQNGSGQVFRCVNALSFPVFALLSKVQCEPYAVEFLGSKMNMMSVQSVRVSGDLCLLISSAQAPVTGETEAADPWPALKKMCA